MSILLWVMLALMTGICYFCNGAIGNNALIGNFLVSVMLILAWGYYIVVGKKSKRTYEMMFSYCLLIFAAAMVQLGLHSGSQDTLLWAVCEVLIIPFRGIQYVVSSAVQLYVVIGAAALTGAGASFHGLNEKK